jgi:hypothetical protein
VETHDAKGKTGETESSRHQSERSEVSKKFDSSLLFAGVTPAPRATSGGGADAKGPTNNPGLEHMSQQGLESSEAGRTTAQNAIDEQSSAKPATPPGHHYGWRQGEHNPHDTVRHRDRDRDRDRDRLTQRERERVRDFLRSRLNEREMERVHQILEGGLSEREIERLREFLGPRLSQREMEKLREVLR